MLVKAQKYPPPSCIHTTLGQTKEEGAVGTEHMPPVSSCGFPCEIDNYTTALVFWKKQSHC